MRSMSIAFVSSEMKEVVEMDEEAGSKDCCSQREASASGHVEFKKILNRGTQDSNFIRRGGD